MIRALKYCTTARMAVTPPSKPLVAIVGATGTGKSDVRIAFRKKKKKTILITTDSWL